MCPYVKFCLKVTCTSAYWVGIGPIAVMTREGIISAEFIKRDVSTVEEDRVVVVKRTGTWVHV